MINKDSLLQAIQDDIKTLEPQANKRLYYINQRKRAYNLAHNHDNYIKRKQKLLDNKIKYIQK